MLRFYDQLRRQSQQVERFEELIDEALGRDDVDRAAARMRTQTRFLAEAFREYERRVRDSGGCDEHTLRERLMAEPASIPVRHVIVTVPDWIADADGLYSADFDLLTRMPGLEALDIVSTERVLGSGFHERLHNWWPGLEESEAGARASRSRPTSRHAAGRAAGGAVVDAARSRRGAGRDRAAAESRPPERRGGAARSHRGRVQAAAAVPVPRGRSLRRGRHSVPASDALPLAAEPTAAALDLVLDAVAVQLYARHARRAAAIAALRFSRTTASRSTRRSGQRARSRAERGALPRRARTAGDVGRGVDWRQSRPPRCTRRSRRRASWRRWPPRIRRRSRWRAC